MPREVPAMPKVYTTVYDNFKGVDFTNDATNVWRKRSPAGVNMLPDDSGRPFKRHGWEVLISNSEICTALGVDKCQIEKCSYFELAGVDHIAVFTNQGVLFYNGDENETSYGVEGITAISKDYDCYSGYDRAFFFEGNGMSAFYIYGNFKVWRYSYDGTFAFDDVTSDITVPTILVSAEADGVGTLYEGYNLLGTMVSITYNNNELFTYWGSDGLVFTVPDSFKEGKTCNAVDVYRYTWNGTTWIDTNNTGVSFASTGIEVHSTQIEDDEIILLYIYGVMLPNNVSEVSKVKVNVSQSTQFDYPLTVDTHAPTSAKECRLWTDDTEHRENGRAWIQFYDDTWKSIVPGEDFIKVKFPSINIDITTYTDETSTSTTASLVGA